MVTIKEVASKLDQNMLIQGTLRNVWTPVRLDMPRPKKIRNTLKDKTLQFSMTSRWKTPKQMIKSETIKVKEFQISLTKKI
jgi:hypothetical protein